MQGIHHASETKVNSIASKISDRVLPATSTWKLKISALSEGQQKTPNIPTSIVRYWNYSAVVVPHPGHSSTDSLPFPVVFGRDRTWSDSNASFGVVKMKPNPRGQAPSRTKGDSRLGLSMARKSTPHFSQFSELMRKCMQGRCGLTHMQAAIVWKGEFMFSSKMLLECAAGVSNSQSLYVPAIATYIHISYNIYIYMCMISLNFLPHRAIYTYNAFS